MKKLPPGGAAPPEAAPLAPAERSERADSLPPGTKWIALTRLPGGGGRVRIQQGKAVVFLDLGRTIGDLIHELEVHPGAVRSRKNRRRLST